MARQAKIGRLMTRLAKVMFGSDQATEVALVRCGSRIHRPNGIGVIVRAWIGCRRLGLIARPNHENHAYRCEKIRTYRTLRFEFKQWRNAGHGYKLVP